MGKKIMSHVTKGNCYFSCPDCIRSGCRICRIKNVHMVSMDPLAHPWNRLIWACISYGSQMANNVTFGSVFGHGFKTSVVIACITVVFTVISLTLIFPDTKEIALDQARKQMEEQGKPEQVIDQGMEIARKGFMTFAILGVVVFTLLVGAIASLIGAAVTKKNPVTPFGNQP